MVLFQLYTKEKSWEIPIDMEEYENDDDDDDEMCKFHSNSLEMFAKEIETFL